MDSFDPREPFLKFLLHLVHERIHLAACQTVRAIGRAAVPSIKSIQTELGFGPVLYGGYVDSYWAMGQIKGHTAVVDAVV